jgi:hypothetical protein
VLSLKINEESYFPFLSPTGCLQSQENRSIREVGNHPKGGEEEKNI